MYHLYSGCQLYFAKPDAMQGTLIDTLLWCRPTQFFGVPRIWEKFEDKLKEVAASKPQFMQNLSAWAKRHGTQKIADQQMSREPSFMYSVANFMVLKRVKAALGLDQCEA